MDMDAVLEAVRAGVDPNADHAAKRRAADLLRTIATWIDGGSPATSSTPATNSTPTSSPAPPPYVPPAAPSIASIVTAALQVLDVLTRHGAAATSTLPEAPIPFVPFQVHR
jgi:hypothetical protein